MAVISSSTTLEANLQRILGANYVNPSGDHIPGLSDGDRAQIFAETVRTGQLPPGITEEEARAAKADPAQMWSPDNPSPQGRATGAVMSGAASFAQSALFIPAALERVLTESVEAGIASATGRNVDLMGPFGFAQEGYELIKEELDEAFGLGAEQNVLDVLGMVGGGLVGGVGGLGATGASQAQILKLFGERFGSQFLRFMTLPQTLAYASKGEKVRQQVKIAGQLAADGALFELGASPRNEGTNLLFGAAAGATGGVIISKLAQRHGRKLLELHGLTPDTPVEVIEGVERGTRDVPITLTKFMANMDAQDDLIRGAAAFEDDLSDRFVTEVALMLQETGDKGAIGAIRGVNLTADQFADIAANFPNYRFDTVFEEGVGPTLLYGLRPELREGGALGYLTDSAVDFYNRHNFFLGQRAVYRGLEGKITGIAGKNTLKFDVPGISSDMRINADRADVMLLDDVLSQYGSGTDLWPRWQAFRDAFDGGWNEAFESFAQNLRAAGNFEDGLRQPLRNFLAAREAAEINARITPDAREVIEQFRNALRRAQGIDESGWGVREHAAARGLMMRTHGEGRVSFTSTTDGQPSGILSAQNAMEYLRGRRVVNMPDFTPDMEIPQEIFTGVARGSQPPNPSRPPDFEGEALKEMTENTSKGFWDRRFQVLDRVFVGAEDRALLLERTTGDPIWTRGIQPVSEAMTRIQNRSAPYMERLRNIVKLVPKGRTETVRGWMLSDLKNQYATTNNMTKKEVRASRLLRKLYDDLFDEFSQASGTNLSVDDYIKNYAPDVSEYIDNAGTVDIETLFRNRGRPVPKEMEFFGEFFKSGEIRGNEDIFVSTMRHIRSGFFNTEARPAWENARQLAAHTKNTEAQEHLVEYLIAQRGIPSLGLDSLRKFTKDFFGSVGVKVSEDQVSGMLNTLMAANAGALMGWRPALIARNLMQNTFLLAPLLPGGTRRIASAMARAGTEINWKYAVDVGAVRKQIPLARADVLEQNVRQGVVRRAARSGLRWYSNADDFNRAVAAITVRDGLNSQRAAYEAGEITTSDLLRNAGLHVQDPIKQGAFWEELTTNGFEAARDFAARETANHVHFLYGSANAPNWVRGASGKLFGNYATWPQGYINWFRRIADADVSLSEKARILGTHGLLTNGVYAMGTWGGANLINWIPFTPSGLIYTGGPFVQPAMDALTVAQGMSMSMSGYNTPPDYNIARNRLTTNTLRLAIPGSYFARDVRRGVDQLRAGNKGLAVLNAIGIRTLEDPSSGTTDISAPAPDSNGATTPARP